LGKKKPVDRKSIAAAMRELVSNEHLHFRDPPGLLAALDAYERGPANFAEYMIAAQSGNAGAAPTYTFDKDAGKSPGFAIIAT
jgi:predicted nucleic-acid-binding protein